ncbi:MAG: signal peptidase II [Oscillospiraceae bacterium]
MNYIALGYSALLVLIDQVIKIIVMRVLAPVLSIPLIDGFFEFEYLENQGAAFGIFEDKTFILVGVTAVVLAVGIVLLVLEKIKDTFLVWSIATVIGGGVGNLVDRIFRGFVIDYLKPTFIEFAVFNFADCCVVVGTILVMVYIIFFEGRKKKPSEDVAISEQL